MLCEALDTDKISYCHWKSNEGIGKSEIGDNDLDLLVSRPDVQKFREILTRLGFKECLPDKLKDLPGVQSFLGYDQDSGKIVHVHGHYQLILGHDLFKNYHLQIEEPYLESAQKEGVFKIPSPEFELIIFVIRMIIKHSTWDTILTFDGKLSKSEKREWIYLQENSDITIVYDVLKKHLPYISEKLFADCMNAITPGQSVFARVKSGARLLSQLNAQSRQPQLVNIVNKNVQHIIKIFRWVVQKQRFRFRLSNGGAIIAILGGDGSGKTTSTEELYRWLSPHFNIYKIHMGKPPWSKTTIAVRGILKIGRTLGLFPFMREPIQYETDEELIKFPGYPWLIREVLTARDRYLKYIKARRYANNGGLVISDRFPIPGIHLMDNAQGMRMTINFPRNWFVRWMIRIEERYYSYIQLPEIIIVLKVPPEVAVLRKTDEQPVSVRARNNEMFNYDWTNVHGFVIDANQSKEKVLSDLKYLIWSVV